MKTRRQLLRQSVLKLNSGRTGRSRTLEIILVFSMAWFLAACSWPDSTRDENLLRGRTLNVTAGNAVRVRTFSARVAPPRNAELAFHVGGVVARLPINEGQKVAKGQLVAQLRATEFRARLDEIQGRLDQARAALSALRGGQRPDERLQHESQERVTSLILANAEKEFDRYSRLVKMGFASRSQYELVQTNFLVAQEEHQAAVRLLEKGRTTLKEDVEAEEGVIRELRGQAAEAELELEDTKLRAPFDGVITQKLAEEGQSLAVDKAVIRLQSVDPIDIMVNGPGPVTTSDICSPGLVEALAEFSGAPGLQYPVQVKDVPQMSEAGTQASPVRFAMKPPSGVAIVPGMMATITVRYRTGGEHASTPSSSPCEHHTH